MTSSFPKHDLQTLALTCCRDLTLFAPLLSPSSCASKGLSHKIPVGVSDVDRVAAIETKARHL